MQKDWFSSWFNTPYYHTLYKHRNDQEASLFIDQITQFLNIKNRALCWDLCCGKGRHSVHLSSKGFIVTGTDLSEQNILEANKNSNDNLEFYTHDMRDSFRINYFDLVLNIFTSFGYFEKREDDLNVFKAITKSLKPKGLFVFDFFNANYVKDCMITNDSKTIDDITFHISKKIENNAIIKSIDFTDKGKDFHYEERVKLFEKSYFEDLAKENSLSIIHTFGNYKLEPFDIKTSPRLILVLQKQ
jgi:SAM-dependent methyltransferase